MTNTAQTRRVESGLVEEFRAENERLRADNDALRARMASVERLSAMLSDPRQWVQNEYTARIADELRAALDGGG